MQNSIEIEHLSREEKIRVMEANLEDLSKGSEQVESPDWHREIFHETKERLDPGQEKIHDWSIVKKKLRSLFESKFKSSPVH